MESRGTEHIILVCVCYANSCFVPPYKAGEVRNLGLIRTDIPKWKQELARRHDKVMTTIVWTIRKAAVANKFHRQSRTRRPPFILLKTGHSPGQAAHRIARVRWQAE